MSDVSVEVTIVIRGDLPADEVQKLSVEIGDAIRHIVGKAKAASVVHLTSEPDNARDTPLFEWRKQGILDLLVAAGAPEEAIAAIKRGDPVMDRWGATNGCDCAHCTKMRKQNDMLPVIIYAIEAVAKESPTLGLFGVYTLSQAAFEEYVPPALAETILKYLSFNPEWDTDGNDYYWRPEGSC